MLSVHSGPRAHNLAVTLGCVAAHSGAISRAGISARTGLNRSTAGRLVDELVRGRLVRELGATVSSSVGRPGTALALDPAGPVALGLDVTAARVTGCVADFTGVVRFHRSVTRRPGRTDHVARLAREALAVVDAAGLPLAGTAVAATEEVAWMAGQPLFGPRVVFDRAVGFAALAEEELLRAGKSYLYLRDGEAALVLDGHLRHGRAGTAPTGSAAPGAGGRLAGEPGLIRQRAAAGHLATLVALRREAEAIGAAVAGHLALLDLDLVVLGGACRELTPWLAPDIPGAVVVAATHGPEAPALGAARSIIRAVVDDPLGWLTATDRR